MTIDINPKSTKAASPTSSLDMMDAGVVLQAVDWRLAGKQGVDVVSQAVGGRLAGKQAVDVVSQAVGCRLGKSQSPS